MNPYIELSRPVNSVMASIAVLIGFLVASSFTLTRDAIVKLVLSCISAFLFSASSMALNDYFDREIDAINQPHRPIPSGRVRPERALAFALIMLIVGLALSSTIGLNALIVAAIACASFTAYSIYLKRLGLIGNLMVSLCVALTFIYGSASYGSLTPLIVLFSIMAFLANTSREVIKGIIDVEGDRARGVRTIAVAWGFRVAAHIAMAFMIAAVVISLMPIVYGLVNIFYTPIIAISDVGLLATTALVVLSPQPSTAARSKKFMLVFMSLALMSFLIGCIKI